MGANDIAKVKFASQADQEILDQFKALARKEGRQLLALLDEAMREHLERKQTGQARKHVIAAYEESLVKFDKLYAELAK